MKAKLIFNLPEDSPDFYTAVKANHLWLALWKMHEYLFSLVDNENEEMERIKDKEELLNCINHEFVMILEDHSINLNEDV